jgi:hypothetical protein
MHLHADLLEALGRHPPWLLLQPLMAAFPTQIRNAPEPDLVLRAAGALTARAPVCRPQEKPGQRAAS